jgi:hypothetical protein
MNYTMAQRKLAILFSILLLLTGSLFTRKAHAEEIIISGNGAESDSQVNVSSSTDTNVSSNNNTAIDNNVNVDANTGNNSVSGNTGGDTAVQTGDTTVNANVQNAANTNVINVNQCCPTGTSSITITNNGSGSVNTVNHTQSNNTNVSSYNNANIVNNFTVNANTGGNTTNYNTGNVYLRTGDVSVNTNVKNGPINTSLIYLGLGGNRNFDLNIKGNGSDSLNLINLLGYNDTNVDVNNVANIYNNVLLTLNTGDNEVDDNNGDVTLITGDIDANVSITNEVNKSEVVIDCDCKEKAPEKPVPAAPVEKVKPQAPTAEKTTSGGEVAGIAMGKVLPETGTNWLFLALIGNIMMFFLGMILRLRSGNSPGRVAVA